MLATTDAPPALVAQVSGMPEAKKAVSEKRFGDAERALRQHLERYPADEEARFWLARVVAWQGRYAEAIAVYEWLLARRPKNADYWFGRGMAQLWAGDAGPAFASLDMARRLAPDDPANWRQAIVALVRQGPERHEAALTLVGQARSRFPREDWDLVPPPPAEKPGPTEAEAAVRYDFLTDGYAPWVSGQVAIRHAFAPKSVAYGRVLETSRFGLLDTEVLAGGTYPLTDQVTGLVEASMSPTANVLARWTATAMGEWALGAGWVGWGRLRHAEWTTAIADTGTLGADVYLGAFRMTYGLSLTRASSGGFPVAVSGALSWMPSDRDALTLRLAAGQEVETVGPGRVVTADVLSAGLEGRWWLTPVWAIAADAGWTRQGNFYQRMYGQLGVRRAI